jgi:hypothetical protein
MTDDIVERLRARDVNDDECWHNAREAADEIERLRAEIERLRAVVRSMGGTP